MHTIDLVKRADELLAMGNAVLLTAYSNGGQHNLHYVKKTPIAGFRSAVLSFINRTFGKDHPHFHEFTAQAKQDL